MDADDSNTGAPASLVVALTVASAASGLALFLFSGSGLTPGQAAGVGIALSSLWLSLLLDLYLKSPRALQRPSRRVASGPDLVSRPSGVPPAPSGANHGDDSNRIAA
jgi:hypothetical protein